MDWRGRRESDNVEDQRSFGAKSLGIGGLILGAIVYYLMGGNPLVYLAQNAGPVIEQHQHQNQDPRGSNSATSRSASESDADGKEDQRKSFVRVILADTEDVWTQEFEQAGRTYEAPKLVLFRGSVKSACGSANAAMGPFYCPNDQRVYLDMGFFDQLSGSLGAKGEAADAYVIAHEVGHHVQTLLGIDMGRGNRASVATELQADCFAGVWASHEKAKSYLAEDDIHDAINAASAVGDDRLQSRNGGEVVPDSFTHGSSAQRMAAFKKGYTSARLQGCL